MHILIIIGFYESFLNFKQKYTILFSTYKAVSFNLILFDSMWSVSVFTSNLNCGDILAQSNSL